MKRNRYYVIANLLLYQVHKFRLSIRFALLNLVLANNSSKVGGQAVIEGVMMRSKHSYSTAVRLKSGEIVCKKEPYISLSQRHKILGWPVIRGFVQLFESMYIGMKSLNYSAELAMEDEKGEQDKSEKSNWKQTVTTGATITFSFAIALMMFMYVPLLISNLINKNLNPLFFNMIAGAIRIVFFLSYLWLISLFKDIRRVFEYHGAEHVSIFTHEAGQELTIENARKYETYHPRCGTSFLLIVALVCIFLFAMIDGIITALIGPYPSIFYRFIVHTTLIPFVSGVSYEILKATDKGKNNPIVALLVKPGLWLQRITTQKPDDKQIEVAFTALRAVL